MNRKQQEMNMSQQQKFPLKTELSAVHNRRQESNRYATSQALKAEQILVARWALQLSRIRSASDWAQGQLQPGQRLPVQRMRQSRAMLTTAPGDRIHLGYVALLDRTLRSRARQALVEADSLRLQDQMRLLHPVN
jgi:hypothetical protein